MRETYRLIRKNIVDKKSKDQKIYTKVIHNEIVAQCNTILIYISTQEEVDTIKLIEHFLKNKRVGVPKIVDGQMSFYYINSLKDVIRGYFNILEPTTNNKVNEFSNTVCITPGICFDKRFYRIGYGGGYYDQFLVNNRVYTIGLSYQECLIDEMCHDSYDQPMDEIITEQKRYIKKV